MSNELYHWGILGMKWGVRRYQNPDGTLTALGKARYGSSDNLRSQYTKKAAKKAVKGSNKGSKPSKDIKNMSDEDLQKLKERLQLEKDVVDLQKKLTEVPEKQQTKGKKFVEDVMTDSGKKIATAAITGAGLYGIAKLLGDESISKSDTGLDIYKSVMRKKN